LVLSEKFAMKRWISGWISEKTVRLLVFSKSSIGYIVTRVTQVNTRFPRRRVERETRPRNKITIPRKLTTRGTLMRDNTINKVFLITGGVTSNGSEWFFNAIRNLILRVGRRGGNGNNRVACVGLWEINAISVARNFLNNCERTRPFMRKFRGRTHVLRVAGKVRDIHPYQVTYVKLLCTVLFVIHLGHPVLS